MAVVEDGKEYATGQLVTKSVADMIQLVKDLSITLASPEFDELCFDFFKVCICDNYALDKDEICKCNCEH